MAARRSKSCRRSAHQNGSSRRSRAFSKNVRTKVTIFNLHFPPFFELVHSRVPKALQAWRLDLENKNKSKAANLLADPSRGQDAGMFEEGWEEALSKEEAIYGKNTNGVMDIGPVLGGDSP